MKRATTSLPVPDSPSRRTVVSVAATCVACFSTSFQAVDSPTTRRRPPSDSISWVRDSTLFTRRAARMRASAACLSSSASR